MPITQTENNLFITAPGLRCRDGCVDIKDPVVLQLLEGSSWSHLPDGSTGRCGREGVRGPNCQGPAPATAQEVALD